MPRGAIKRRLEGADIGGMSDTVLAPRNGRDVNGTPASPPQEPNGKGLQRASIQSRSPRMIGDVVVLTFLPGLIGGAEALHRAAGVLEAAGSASLLIVNLAPMRFITSVFLSMLVHVRQEMIARGGALKLCGADGVAREVIEAACLDSVFEIYKDEAAAFRSCAAPRRDGFQQLLD